MGRPRKSKSTVPVAPGELSEREQLSEWWRIRMQEMENEHEHRVKMLRSVGEHPSPIFARQVKMFGGLGMPKILAAKLLGISVKMLDEHYSDEYEMGHAETVGGVAANMIRIATSTTDPQAAKVGMDLLSRRGGNEWKPPAQKVKFEDDREQPKNVIDSSKLTPEERQQLRLIIEGAIERQEGGEAEPLQPGEEETE